MEENEVKASLEAEVNQITKSIVSAALFRIF